jgi:hypothetical protein
LAFQINVFAELAIKATGFHLIWATFQCK